jgi:hypothetical protein
MLTAPVTLAKPYQTGPPTALTFPILPLATKEVQHEEIPRTLLNSDSVLARSGC